MSAEVQPPAPKPRKRRRARGALAVIGALLVGSAVLRIGLGAEEALARAVEDSAAVAETPAKPAPKSCAAEDDIAPILVALDQREARIARRESDLQVRVQALSVAETEIDRRMAALVEAEEKLSATLALAQTAAEDDLTRLTSVYANMKPKQAAALFATMDPDFAAGFLGRMQPESAAAIMAGLDPQTAYSISAILAGRNANAPSD